MDLEREDRTPPTNRGHGRGVDLIVKIYKGTLTEMTADERVKNMVIH